MTFLAQIERVDRAVLGHLGGVTVTYRPEFEDPIEFTAMLDEFAVLVEVDRPGVEQIAPSLFLRAEDLPIHPDDDAPEIRIAGVDYRVIERRPDGAGGIRLRLHRLVA